MRRSLVWMAALLVPTIAAAQTPPANHSSPSFGADHFISLPFLFGVDAAVTPANTATGFFWGVRPEYIFAWTNNDARSALSGFGFGPYAEIVGSTGTSQIFLGGGATAVGYFGRFGVAASAGLDVDWLRAVPNASPVFGLFLGFRETEISGVDLPFGLHVDFRPAVGDVPMTVIVAAQLDLIMALGVGMIAVLTGGIHD